MARQLQFRVMSAQELPIILGWAAQEGWNPGRGDAAPFLAADCEGFCVAEIDGRPVAAISVVNHDPSLAFLGLYLCRPEHRGKGIGFALWKHAIEHAGERTIGLDGVPAQQQNYERSGFVHTGSTMRWQGVLAGAPREGVRSVCVQDLAAIVALDRCANGYQRDAFLNIWLQDTPERVTLVLDRGGELAGFVTIRRALQGCRIGPLVAPDVNGAIDLILAAQNAMPGDIVVVDAPEMNAPLISWMKRQGFTCSFQTARMYRGPAPNASPLLQGVGTLELG
jgi:GNAT superfamily N-acetyltransferase